MLTVSIQAGGESTRMGQNKALMPFLGKPLIQRVVERVSFIADEIVVTTNKPEEFHFLNVPIFIDLIPAIGALGGLLTALSVANNPMVAVIACDLPFANPELILACQDLLRIKNSDAVIPSSVTGLEPLHAVYNVESCLPAVEAAVEAGKRRMIAWHDEVNVYVLSSDETARYDPDGITFWNVNTPEDYKRAERKALESGN